MSSHPWYKRYGADFVHGTLGLTLEEKGAYSLCLDLIYDRNGPIPDDARWLAGVCGVSVRKWAALRDRLIATGKLVERPGFLSNERAEREIENTLKAARKHSENGAKGGNKRAENASHVNENNEIAEAGLKHRARDQILEPEPDKKNRAIALSSVEPDVTDAMVEIYHEAGAGIWPKVAKLTPPRKSKCRKRLAECGGLDGWRSAMARARASPFLTGGNKNGWTASFDFFLQAESFTKLLEGTYDARQPSGPAQPRAGHSALIAAARSRLAPAPDGGGGAAGVSRGIDAHQDGSGVYRLADRGR